MTAASSSSSQSTLSEQIGLHGRRVQRAGHVVGQVVRQVGAGHQQRVVVEHLRAAPRRRPPDRSGPNTTGTTSKSLSVRCRKGYCTSTECSQVSGRLFAEGGQLLGRALPPGGPVHLALGVEGERLELGQLGGLGRDRGSGPAASRPRRRRPRRRPGTATCGWAPGSSPCGTSGPPTACTPWRPPGRKTHSRHAGRPVPAGSRSCSDFASASSLSTVLASSSSLRG